MEDIGKFKKMKYNLKAFFKIHNTQQLLFISTMDRIKKIYFSYYIPSIHQVGILRGNKRLLAKPKLCESGKTK